MTKDADIRIFVSTQTTIDLPKRDYILPIEVGATLLEEHTEYQRDDAGDNISAYNGQYCELTATYWAWKNVDADYYGFFHYRRWLSVTSHNKYPYRYTDARGENLLAELGLDRLHEVLQRADIVAPRAEKTYMDVRSQYATTPDARVSDLDKAVEILLAKYPEYSDAARAYLGSDACYYGNIFVMNKERFVGYAEMLFDVLAKVSDDVPDLPPRTLGYLGERICGIYIMYCKMTDRDRVAELQRADLAYYFKDAKKRKLIYTLLPPGTALRAKVKKILAK